jgi:hypothetical protein
VDVPANSPAADVPATPAESGPEQAATTRAGASAAIDLGLLLGSVWALVAFFFLARLAHGAWSVRRVVRSARPLDAPTWQTPLYEIADRLGLDAAPRLLQSDEVKMPFRRLGRRPSYSQPGRHERRRQAPSDHELGHVRRATVGTLSRVACALYWFHPLVWTAARHTRAESGATMTSRWSSAPSQRLREHLLDIVTCP